MDVNGTLFFLYYTPASALARAISRLPPVNKATLSSRDDLAVFTLPPIASRKMESCYPSARWAQVGDNCSVTWAGFLRKLLLLNALWLKLSGIRRVLS